MSTRSPVVPKGQLAPFAVSFREELRTLGYSRSAAKKQLNLMVHLDAWLEAGGLDLSALASRRVEGFFAARRQAGYANLLTTRSTAPLVAFLRRGGVIPAATPEQAVGQVDVVVAQFAAYLREERCLVDGTVRFYARVARRFLVGRFGDGPLDLSALTAGDVTSFVTRECKPLSISSSRQSVSALRALLRFSRLEGQCSLALDQAVLSVAGWNPSLPRALDASDVERLLASCDHSCSLGRRDYAILMLLARLGLRAGEVVALELGDIDWHNGEVVVRGKRRRRDRMPLPHDVGEALVGYLRRGRPTSADRHVFVRHFAPHVALADAGAIRGVLARACERAGMPYANAHRLRHTLATGMLQGGATLREIATVLRQSSAAAAATYAKVDHARLRALAVAWPEVAR
jgi:integrase/recombinase XerD